MLAPAVGVSLPYKIVPVPRPVKPIQCLMIDY